MSVSAGVRAGPTHRRTGVGCDDVVSSCTVGGRHVLALADGAGSAARGGAGASRVVSSGCAAAAAALTAGSSLVDAVLSAQSAAVVELAGDSSFATTFVVGVVDPSVRTAAVAAVGDSFAVSAHHRGVDGPARLVAHVSQPVSEFANVTVFVSSSPPPEPSVWVFDDGDLAGLALSSDGLTQVSLVADGSGDVRWRPHDGFWLPVFARAAISALDVPALLEHCDVRAGLNDDASLVVWARPAFEGLL